MTERYQEYLRRNLLHAKAIGAKANASTALKRLEMQTRPPQWLVNALRGILERVDPLPAELARWRDLAPDTPDFVRAELETSSAREPAGTCSRHQWAGRTDEECQQCATENREAE